MWKNNLELKNGIKESKNIKELIPEIQNIIDLYKNLTLNELDKYLNTNIKIVQSIWKLEKLNQFLEPKFEWSTAQNLVNSLINNFTEKSYKIFKKKFKKIYWLKTDDSLQSVPFFALLDILNFIEKKDGIEDIGAFDIKIEEYYHNFKIRVIEHNRFQKYSKAHLDLLKW